MLASYGNVNLSQLAIGLIIILVLSFYPEPITSLEFSTVSYFLNKFQLSALQQQGASVELNLPPCT